ncbi:MarR family winged helix-turn-helix transcriptional regulator [Clavibacter michiganensis]|uniref:Organic hydroperoxide resistance transcriptional regulator n=1 Tax=Clavibacter michiganensis subsp. michiganensis TaxID=33013 RepID=A0A1Y3FGG7_CLAMM|nr:MarR family transcriptional regulator [Clavibacter michiganensis]MBW8027217.1 MarR family transcriptional regulator [Clavibacter michiganensis subsp. michiganensis]MDO4027512.1 MarR family transcriptional regulator [Clavibacter michiganensis]MDO4030982.1 MarR family transcriptional regulator [Clavibacter michiganensis]MDO4039971.1 MarR family transcriptional regulator [Clavibacter michiganensis]MDO4043987.1 MarR family transcriptional regulator [Clavibacter michiganensis]
MAQRSLTLLQDETGVLLAAASRAVVSLYRPLLQPLNLTHPQYLVLLALDEEEPQAVVDLAEKLHLTPGTLSPLLKRLEVFGYVTRFRDMTDERRLSVGLTDAGREMLPVIWRVGDQVRRDIAGEDAGDSALRDLLQDVLDRATAQEQEQVHDDPDASAADRD